LAHHFNISNRTVYRDIRSLEAAGIPVGAETGKGYFLVAGYHLPPVMFTTEEIGALLMAEKISDSFTDNKTRANLTLAFNKIRAVLESSKKDWISEIEKRIVAYDSAEENLSNNGHFYDIQNTIYEKKVIEIKYNSPEKNIVTQRLVEPVSLFFTENHWYLAAYCYSRNAYRIFRVDRIESLQITEKPFQHIHPDNRTVMEEILESKPLQKVILRLENGLNYERFKHKINPGLISEESLGERIEISFFTDSLPVLGKWLLYSDCDVEIVQPVELKNIMWQYATEIAHRYCN
jgi:predicted DNA-binding transcriptional regulator YafY